MIFRPQKLPTVLALLLLGASLAGCGTINERASAAMGDYIPQWAGGLPSDAPPRPGTAKYDAWMQERERERQMPADQRPPDPSAPAAGTPKPLFGAQKQTPTKPGKPAKPPGSTASTSSNNGTPSGLDPVH